MSRLGCHAFVRRQIGWLDRALQHNAVADKRGHSKNLSRRLFPSDVYIKTSIFWTLLDIDAYPLGRFCMPLHGAATTYQGPDTAVHDVSNTAYRLVSTKSSYGYCHLVVALQSLTNPVLSNNGPPSVVVLEGLQLQRTKGVGQQSSFTTTSHSLHRADRVPRPAPLQHHFTIHNGIAKSYYAFQASFAT